MKYLGIILILLVSSAACDRELKEHPLPPELAQQVENQGEISSPGAKISGIISLDSVEIPENPLIFVIARPLGVQGGPPLAVKRYSLVKFPLEYTIGQKNTMLEGVQFKGRMVITVRLDKDGDPRPGIGDIEGSTEVEAGEENADIVLNRVIQSIEAQVSPSAAAQPSASVTGVIRLSPELIDQIPGNWKLFLLARPEGVRRGPPLAVKRLEAVEFPYTFSLGQEDTMMPGAVFRDTVNITARIDQDGNASASPGDIEGTLTAQAGDENVEIILDKVVGS